MTFLDLDLAGWQEAVDAYDAMGVRGRDLMPIWGEVYKIFLRGEERRFGDQGPGWAPLKPSTVARKGFATIMVETGALRSSLTAGGAPGAVFRPTPSGVEMGTDYKSPRQTKGWANVALAYFHQEGLPPNPRRPLIDENDSYVEEFAPLVGEWLLSGEVAAEVTA